MDKYGPYQKLGKTVNNSCGHDKSKFAWLSFRRSSIDWVRQLTSNMESTDLCSQPESKCSNTWRSIRQHLSFHILSIKILILSTPITSWGNVHGLTIVNIYAPVDRPQEASLWYYHYNTIQLFHNVKIHIKNQEFSNWEVFSRLRLLG